MKQVKASRFKAVYNAVGTYMASSVIDTRDVQSVNNWGPKDHVTG